MDNDVNSAGWPLRAVCRWLGYSTLWILTVTICLLSSFHPALYVIGVVLGCGLSLYLPLMFATLFEAAYSRKARIDAPLLCCPCLGGAVVLAGVLFLLQAGLLVVWLLSSVTVKSAGELCDKFSLMPRKELPRVVCVESAFVKTDWEASKLECKGEEGHVLCMPTFGAAPIFDSQELAQGGMASEIKAWAVSHGKHVDANYRPDGSLCGYMSGHYEFDFYLPNFMLAISRVVELRSLAEPPEALELEGLPIPPASMPPLAARPIILTADLTEVTYKEQMCILCATMLLCCCPCAGPLPLGIIFAFFCWARHDKYSGRHTVRPDEFDDGTLDGLVELTG